MISAIRFSRVGATLAFLLLTTLLLTSCDNKDADEKDGQANDSAAVTEGAQKQPELPSIPNADPAVWLEGRYGPDHGIIVRELEIDGRSQKQTIYFRNHGAEEALQWFYGADESGPQYVGLVKDHRVTFRGPADTAAITIPWKADPSITLPNFRRLDDDMRRLYDLKELDRRTFLGRESQGYSMKIGATESHVWVWDGILMYGELDAVAGGRIPPKILKVISIDTVTVPPDSRFVIE